MSLKILKTAIVFSSTISLLALGCIDKTSSKPSSQSVSRPGSQAKESTLKLKLHKVYDTQKTGKLVCTFLIPEGWTSKDFVQWIPGDYMTPVVGSSTVASPDGAVQFSTMSGLEKNFGRGPSGGFGELPPKSFAGYLLGIWKKDHPGATFTVLEQGDKSVPIPYPQVPKGGEMKMVKSSLKLKYKISGKSYVVKTQATMLVMQTIPVQTPIGGRMFEGGWLIGDFYQVSAPEERLPEAMKTASIVLTSSQLDPHWFSLVSQVQQQISQAFYQGVAAAGEMSRIISQTNDAVSDSIMSSYEANQKAEDTSASGFDDYIRGVDRYQDENGKVALPSGYAHAWKNDRNEYMVSDDNSYNPNVAGPGGTWHELDRQH